MPGQGGSPESLPQNSRASRRRKRQLSPSAPDVIARAQRDAKCVEYRRGGMTFDAIARTLGYAGSGHAHTAFMNFMNAAPAEDIDTARRLEGDRLDMVQSAIWSRCLDPDDSNQHWAIDRYLKITDQRARLLGLNRPVRQEVTVLTDATVSTAINALQEANQRLAVQHGIELPALPAYTEVLDVERA